MNSSEFAPYFRDQYYKYLLYLDQGNKPYSFEEERIHIDGYIHASNLFDCPLKGFKERTKADPVFPEFLKENNPTVLHRMRQGNMCAQPLQETLLYAYQFDEQIAWALPERSVISHELKVQGRIDGFFTEVDGTQHIVEFKHRLPPWNQKQGQPKIGDVFQMLAYKEITQADQAHLIIVNTPTYAQFHDPMAMIEIWSLIPQDEGYILVSEHGYSWQDSKNDPTIINVRVLREEVDRQLAYLNGETEPPIDLLDRSNSWQCASVKLYPKENRPGVLMPVCPHWCHSNREQAEHGIKYTDQEVLYDF